MEQSLKALGINNMTNTENWLPIKYHDVSATDKKCNCEQVRQSVETQTNSNKNNNNNSNSNNNKNNNRSNVPHFHFPGPQSGSETSTTASTRKQGCTCKYSTGGSMSFIQANRKRMQYERLGIPITVQEVVAMKRFNSQHKAESKKPERFLDSFTQTDSVQLIANNSYEEPCNTDNIDDEDNNFKSDHSDSEAKKYFTASKEKEDSKMRHRDIDGQEYYKNTSRYRASNSSIISSSSDEYKRSRSLKRKSGIIKRSFSSQNEHNSRKWSSDSRKSNYSHHNSGQTSAKYCLDEDISVSDEKSTDYTHSNAQTKRAPSSQSRHCSCSCDGPKDKSESDDAQYFSYSNVQKKHAPSRQAKNCIRACESTRANYLYCGPDPKLDDTQNSTQTQRASSFQSQSQSKSRSHSKSCSCESSRAYHFNGEPYTPQSRVQSSRFSSYQPKFRKYSCESTSPNHFVGGRDPKSDEISFLPHTYAQTKRVTSFQPKFGKYSRESRSAYQYKGGPDRKTDDAPLYVPQSSKVETKHTTAFQQKYRTNSCDSAKAKYLNHCQERKSEGNQHILPHSKFQPKRTSSKYARSKFFNCSQSSDEESKPSDSSEPVYSKCFREATANQLKFDKNMLKILEKHNRKTALRSPYEDILKSFHMDDRRSSSLAQKRFDKHNCFCNPTKERDSQQGYSSRRYAKSESNAKGNGTFLYRPPRHILKRQDSSQDSSSVNPTHCTCNDASADSAVELESSGTITDVWHKESVTHKSQISTESDDRLSGGLWKKRLSLCSKNLRLKTSTIFDYNNKKYIGQWDRLFNSGNKKNTIENRMMLLREFQYYAEYNFKRTNMKNDFSWKSINAIDINSRLCKCPVGSRTCVRILNESLLSHFIRKHLDEPGIELLEIFERDRFLLVFNAKALQIDKNACMSVLAYGGFEGQSGSKPANRFMPVLNSDLPWAFENFRGYLPLMLMICRSKRSAFKKSIPSDSRYSYSSSNRKRVHFEDDDHRSVKNTEDDDQIVLWVASLELPEPIYVMLTVFNKAITTTRTSIVKVRSIMKSHEITDFKSKEESHMLLSDADIKVLSNFNKDGIYLELSIHEYFHDYPCVQPKFKSIRSKLS